LRGWLVDQMARLGITCSLDNVVIVSGSQQALDYLGKLFLSPGDTALVTWPTYLGALQAFNAYEPAYDQLSLGNRTGNSYRQVAAAAGGRAKFAYLSADFANPTGETLTLSERERLLDLAEELDIAVVEDAAYQALRYDGEPIPPILALELARKGSDIERTRTIYCGSFSKTLSPGLRVGFVVAGRAVISKLVLIKQAADLHSSTINQMAIAEVAAAVFDHQVMRIRGVYKRRRDSMLAALERHMPPTVAWTRPEGGMFVWLTLTSDVDATALLDKAIKTRKVAFVPGQAFHADGCGANTLRLSFSCADEAAIEEGIARLGALIGDEIGRLAVRLPA
jgi:DNA-binding transcriptional MocR family regulator